MVHEQKIAGYDITVPKHSAFQCETDPMMFKMHMLMSVVARRGGGKGVFTAAVIERLPIDRLILVSPSALSNKELLDRFKKILDPADIFDDVNDPMVHDKVLAIVDKERDLFEEYQAKMKRYNSALKKVHSGNPLFQIPDSEMLLFGEGPPKHKWGGRKPCILCYYDDIVGAGCMLGRGARRLTNMALRHRHAGQLQEGGSLGLSLIFNTQSFVTHGALPKSIRNNLTVLALGKVTSGKDLKAIYEELAGEVDEDTFFKLYTQATEKPFQFFVLDMHPKKSHPSPYRRGLDTFLIP